MTVDLIDPQPPAVAPPAVPVTGQPVAAPPTAPAERRPFKVIRPSRGWAPLNLREVWTFRDLLFTLAGRDLKLRYRQTALGVVWVVLQPLLAAGIFSFVFGKVAKLPGPNGIPYFLFSYCGLTAWRAFENTLTKSSQSLVGNAGLISKVAFPRLVLPLSTVFATLVDFGVALALLLVMLLACGLHPQWPLLLMPVWLGLILLLALGSGLLAGSFMVRYRDVGHILPVATQMLLYGSPIAYAVSAVPPKWHSVYMLNPLSGLLEAFRWSLLPGLTFQYRYAAYSAAVSAAAFVIGGALFRRAERGFADVI